MNDGHRYNIDGIVSFWLADPQEAQFSYTQTFRNGCIEAVDEFLLRPDERNQNQKVVPSAALREYLDFSLRNYFGFLERQEVSPPIFVFLTILDAEGYHMATRGPSFRRYSTPIDRSVVQSPEQILEEYGDDPSPIIDSMINSVWQACGYAKEQYG